MPSRTAADAALNRLSSPTPPPYALLHRNYPDGSRRSTVDLLIGDVETVHTLADIPLPDPGTAPPGTPRHDALALIPYRQILERGFTCHDDDTPLQVLVVKEQHTLPLELLLEDLPNTPVGLQEKGFDPDDESYAAVVKRVLADEIGSGEGANFVIRRDFTADLTPYTPDTPLALLKRLLLAERGAYWTFLVHTGPHTLIGASPETHVRLEGGTATMNPISGTYCYPPSGPTPGHLLRFLADRKETEELSMVLDEELKMMCAIADSDIQVRGPWLKEMAHLAHTEYTITGHTLLDVRDILKHTMFAATVTGSPLQNACRVIHRYEKTGRGYYSGALALIGRSPTGAPTLDAPILIRTAEIAPTGRAVVRVGATLVRNSRPAAEVAETHAKAAGILTALRGTAPRTPPPLPAAPLCRDAQIRTSLAQRRTNLSPFWLTNQTAPTNDPRLRGVSVLVIDAEDAFTAMLAHMLRALGMTVQVIRFNAPVLPAALAGHHGPVVLGPGPGNPLDTQSAKMNLLKEIARDLLSGGKPLLGVCLGHEILATVLGAPLVRRTPPHQGAQLDIDLFGSTERVGFYNTFTARTSETQTRALAQHTITLSRDAASGDIHALRGRHFAGIQFHPESALTLHGPAILARLLPKPTAAGKPQGEGRTEIVEQPSGEPTRVLTVDHPS